MRRLLWLWLLLSLSACLTRATQLVPAMTASMGWYRVESRLKVDKDGAVMAPPGGPEAGAYMDRVQTAFDDEFTQVWIDGETPCLGVVGAERAPKGTVYVMVHGIKGIGAEWMSAIPTLARTQPAALFMFRWMYYDERGHILDFLVKGLDRIAQCYPNNRVVALGHSAGGVLLAFAASRLTIAGDTARRVDLVTVASPLAGVGFRAEIDVADDDTHFFNDLGAVRGGYPAAAPSVFVTHLRTQYPADTVMEPNRMGYAPNAPEAVVKGATLIDVPATLGHDESLGWAAQQIAAGKLP